MLLLPPAFRVSFLVDLLCLRLLGGADMLWG